jgi:Domain of unknown function (DUF1707)
VEVNCGERDARSSAARAAEVHGPGSVGSILDFPEGQRVVWSLKIVRPAVQPTPDYPLLRLGACRDGHNGATALRFPCIAEAPVTAKPGEDMAAAAGGRGRLRASRADREHVVDVLKAAFVQGLLTKDEFDMRVGQTLASRTYAELAALTADISAGLIGAQPPRKPARARGPHPQNKAVNSWACAALAVLALGAALFTGNFGLFFAVVVAILGILFVVGGRMAFSSHKKRSGRHQW